MPGAMLCPRQCAWGIAQGAKQVRGEHSIAVEVLLWWRLVRGVSLKFGMAREDNE